MDRSKYQRSKMGIVSFIQFYDLLGVSFNFLRGLNENKIVICSMIVHGDGTLARGYDTLHRGDQQPNPSEIGVHFPRILPAITVGRMRYLRLMANWWHFDNYLLTGRLPLGWLLATSDKVPPLQGGPYLNKIGVEFWSRASL